MLLSSNTTIECLINAVDKIRTKLGINLEDYPIDLFSEIRKYPLLRILADFSSKAFGGFLIHNKEPEVSTIVLNATQNFEDKQFALGHEAIHYFCHSSDNKLLTSSHRNKSSDIYERQANEGAAELIIPAQLFVPEIKSAIDFYGDVETAFIETARIYHVAKDVVKYRYYNLNLQINY